MNDGAVPAAGGSRPSHPGRHSPAAGGAEAVSPPGAEAGGEAEPRDVPELNAALAAAGRTERPSARRRSRRGTGG